MIATSHAVKRYARRILRWDEPNQGTLEYFIANRALIRDYGSAGLQVKYDTGVAVLYSTAKDLTFIVRNGKLLTVYEGMKFRLTERGNSA